MGTKAMKAQDFIAKWAPEGPAGGLNEEQGAQSHFIDLCDLLEVPRPGTQAGYVFEEKSMVVGEHTRYADVSLRNHFAWENKAPGKDLGQALRQLQGYSLALGNPPLLVVCDRLRIRVRTQFNGHPSERFEVTLPELAMPDKRALLRRLWTDPESFRPRQTSRDITEATAKSFATLADQLRKRGHDADKVAHFLTQCLFCFFAEDVGLLPSRLFERTLIQRRYPYETEDRALPSERLTRNLDKLFHTMRLGGEFGVDDVPWFNGGLFKKIEVPKLEIILETAVGRARVGRCGARRQGARPTLATAS